MCLGIPGRVIRLLEGYHGQLALVDVAGAERKVNIGMLEDQSLSAGDWVVIHMGFAVERVTNRVPRRRWRGSSWSADRVSRPRRGGDSRCAGWSKGWASAPSCTSLPRSSGCPGSVANDSRGVVAEVEGPLGGRRIRGAVARETRRRWRSSSRWTVDGARPRPVGPAS